MRSTFISVRVNEETRTRRDSHPCTYAAVAVVFVVVNEMGAFMRMLNQFLFDASASTPLFVLVMALREAVHLSS